MADPRDTVVVGFDLGHGETAVTVARAENTAGGRRFAPRALSPRGRPGREPGESPGAPRLTSRGAPARDLTDSKESTR